MLSEDKEEDIQIQEGDANPNSSTTTHTFQSIDVGDETFSAPLAPLETQATFYKKWIEPRLEKGFLSNLISFILMIIGRGLLFAYPSSTFVKLFYNFGLFGFAGGITNWLAIKMLFDRVPFLYGSGVIPRRFKEIRETVKNTIMNTFFDEAYLKKYLNGFVQQKAEKLLEGGAFTNKITQILDSPEVDQLIGEKLNGLMTKPEGMFLAMVGLNPLALKPLVKPFVVGMATDFLPMLIKKFDLESIIDISTIRNEIDNLMSTKLQQLTAPKVKELMENVIREHLGWLIVWGNVFGGLLGIVSVLIDSL